MRYYVCVSFLFVITLFGCQRNQKDNVFTRSRIRELSSENLSLFKKLTPQKFKTLKEFQVLSKIDSIVLRNLEGNKDNIVDREVLLEINDIQGTILKGSDQVKLDMSKSFYNENDLVLFEYFVGNAIIKRFYRLRYDFQFVKPITVPSNDTLHLGDEFEVKIYLAGIDTLTDFIAIVDADTLPLDRGGVPVYNGKASERGNMTKTGVFQFHYMGDSFYEFPFSIDYVVK